MTLATDTTLAELLAACRSPAGRDCDTTHLVMADRLDDLERGEWAEFPCKRIVTISSLGGKMATPGRVRARHPASKHNPLSGASHV